MAALNETPRQKMIGILYLVLLGIAATTITDTVLDAFSNLTVSLETSTRNVQNTVSDAFAAFEATKLKSDPVRNTPPYERAKKIRQYVDELNTELVHLKDTLINHDTDKYGEIRQKGDVEASPRFLRKGLFKKLKADIENTHNEILAAMDASEKKDFNFTLSANDPPKRAGRIPISWEEDNFGDGIPLVAAVTALTKIQSDLKNTEADVIGRILQADKSQVVLDRFEAVAVAPTSYVFIGEQYKADVFLTASSKTSNNEIIVGGQKLNVVDGKGLYTAVPTSEGEKKWGGVIRVKQADNTVKEYTLKEQTYTAAKPSATISPDKMNVFYIGLENPLSVSAPGIANEKLRVSLSSGTLTGSAGHYIVKVAQPGNITVSVSGEFEGGKSKVMGTKEFRVKRVPAPRVQFCGKSGGRINAVAMKTQNRIFAVLQDFEFEAPFKIEHFTMYVTKPRADPIKLDATSNSLTPDMIKAINGITAGSRVYFDLVDGIGVDGMKRQLDPIIFTVE
jgi:gliding motility-associated protein GldM